MDSLQLTIGDVSKKFNGTTVFKAVSGRVGNGEVLVITGPNGSGKSTLLKCICHLTRPTSGTVKWWRGKELLSSRQAAHLIGYVAPDAGLYDNLTVWEHLAFFAGLRGLKPDSGKLQSLLNRVQLFHYRHYPAGRLSSGMKQRLKLACALFHSPTALVLDEPSTNLDNFGKALLDEIITTHLSQGLVIIATNEAEEVAKFGKEVISLGAPSMGPD